MGDNYRYGYGSADEERPTRFLAYGGGLIVGPLPTDHNMHYAKVLKNGDLSFFSTGAPNGAVSTDRVAWLSMSGAPKDGVAILGHEPGCGTSVLHWVGFEKGWADANGCLMRPDRWMPIPLLPELLESRREFREMGPS